MASGPQWYLISFCITAREMPYPGMKYEFGAAIMERWAEGNADRTGDDIQARSTLCSDAVVAETSSGFA